MNETRKTGKTIRIVLNVLLWFFVIFAIIVTILAFAAQRSADGIPTINGKCYLTVLSDSMSPTFKQGDLIVCKKLTTQGQTSLKEGDVISFHTAIDVDGDGVKENVINTHRIIAVEMSADGTQAVRYTTRGDHNVSADEASVHYTDVVAKYTGTHFRGLGNFLSRLRKPGVFFAIVVLPLTAFFFYELFVFIKTVFAVKNEGKKIISAADEELIKQKAIEEYLNRQTEQDQKKTEENDPKDLS